MAFLTSREFFDDDGLDPAEQPTEPLCLSALLALLETRRQARSAQQEPIRPRPRPETMCPLCCMDKEEKMTTFLPTDGAFLWPCAFHLEQITYAENAEDLEFYAQILQVAYLRYSWPPGY